MTGDGFFDDTVARTYDRDHGGTDPTQIERTVECLAQLAGAGPALEFAVGTGSIALPQIDRGHNVHGIDLSRAMIAELRNKETGVPMNILVGDIFHARVPGAFSLVFLMFNGIDNLTTQEAQIACFRNAARHLMPAGGS